MLRTLTTTLCVAALYAPSARAWAAEGEQSLVDSLRLETHGFVSFGLLRTWGNNVFANDTIDGTDEFNEAALNVIARPMERVRLGAQLFMRDLGRYDNGRVELDWAYVDIQAHALCDLQLGRVKIPIGLYNEIQDVDAARTPVFMPQSIYPTRLRDLQISVDGGKLSGRADVGAAGVLAYTVFGGIKHFDDDGSYSAYVGETSRITVTDAEASRIYGAMLHWDTPLPGVGVRLSAYQSRDIVVEGSSLSGPAHFVTDSRSLVASLEWEPGDWTFAVEYLNLATDGETTVGALTRPYEFDYHGGYASATWHAAPWIELYGAAEYRHNDLVGRPTSFGWTWVGAVNVMPLRHWAIKAEYQFQDNAVTVQTADNPQGIASHWHLLALKTTVDF